MDFLRLLMSVLWKRINKKKYDQKLENNFLIVLPQTGVGDTVLWLDFLFNLCKLSSMLEKSVVHVAAADNVCSMIKKFMPTEKIQFISLTTLGHNSFNDYKKFCTILGRYKFRYVIGSTRMVCFIFAGIVYGHVYVSMKSNILKNLICKLLLPYGTFVFHKSDEMLLKTNKRIFDGIMGDLGISNFIFENYKIPSLCSKEQFKEKYCVICTGIATSDGHLYQHRVWEIEKFKRVVEFILRTTNLYIIFTGDDNEKSFTDAICASFDNFRVINLVGKTNFEEWVEILRKAEFVFGNDSGYIHLTSKLGTQAFVVAGYWNYGRFLPYPEDYCEIVPIGIWGMRQKCELCFGNINVTCCDIVEKKGVYKCIDDVKANDVIKVLSKWLKNKNMVEEEW